MISILQTQNHRIKPIALALVCFSLLFCNTWIPVPVTVLKDLSIPFPCQNNGCGCENATQCWESCGCHSDSEKLAWATKNGVTPPRWFSPKVSVAKNTASKKSSSSDPAESCCCCCSKKATCDPTQHADQPKTSRVFLILKQQRKCQGHSVVDGYQQFEIELCETESATLAVLEPAEPIYIKSFGRPLKTFPHWDPLPS